jgi:DNA-directed RNA polymerase subunit F
MDKLSEVAALNSIHQQAEDTAEMALHYFKRFEEKGAYTSNEALQQMHSIVNKMQIIHSQVASLLEEGHADHSYIFPFLNGQSDVNELIAVVEASPHRLAKRNAKWLRQRTRTPLPPAQG